MDPTQLLPMISLLSLVTVEYGGWALLTFVTGGKGLSDAQLQFFRAGHAHAGVLLVLSLVYFLYLDRTAFAEGTKWAAGIALLVGILAQAGGFFVHMARGGVPRSSAGTRFTRGGALLIAVALLTLVVGIAEA